VAYHRLDGDERTSKTNGLTREGSKDEDFFGDVGEVCSFISSKIAPKNFRLVFVEGMRVDFISGTFLRTMRQSFKIMHYMLR